MISSGLIRDLSIINLSYALLEYEQESIFIDEEHTKKILELKQTLFSLLANYSNYSKKIVSKTKKYLQEILTTPLDYTLPLTIFALKLLSLTFPANQRKGKPLDKDLEELWQSIKDIVNDCENKFYDTVSEDLVVSCEEFYYKVIRVVR